MATIADIDLSRNRDYTEQVNRTQTNPNHLPHIEEKVEGSRINRIGVNAFLLDNFFNGPEDYLTVTTDSFKRRSWQYEWGVNCECCGSQLIRYDVRELEEYGCLCEECHEDFKSPVDFDQWYQYTKKVSADFLTVRVGNGTSFRLAELQTRIASSIDNAQTVGRNPQSRPFFDRIRII